MKIRLIGGNAKCCHLKDELERDFAAAIYLSEALLPSQVFALG
jgi:hypothetical protein